jgi:hypothetical protein
MNVALPALIVFILLLPGFVFRSRFKRVERTSLDFSPFGQVVSEAVILAVALHAVWLLLTYWLAQQRLVTDVVLRLAASDAAGQAAAIAAISKADGRIGVYFATLLAFTYFAPVLVRAAIIKWKLDRSDAKLTFLLRFHEAPWYYLLTGADFERGKEPDLISVSSIVNTGGGPVLYTGFLEDFVVTPEGELDRIVLSGVTRRPLDLDKEMADETAAERFYPIEGDYFVLRYSEAITLNIKYISLPDASLLPQMQAESEQRNA